MPIYEYRCANCGFQKEALQKLSDAPLKDCPECGKPALAKMLTAAGFQLKGSGWYVTDFKNKPQEKNTGSSGKTTKTVEDSTASGAANAETAKSAAPDKTSTDSSAATTAASSSSSAAKPSPSTDNK